MPSLHRRRLGAEFGGNGKEFRGPKFVNALFRKKMSIFTPKISDNFVLVIDRIFQALPVLTFSHNYSLTLLKT